MKKCPFCAEEIQDAAVKCKHCGSMLSEVQPSTSPGRTAPPENSIDDEIKRLINTDGKIHAIKFLREKKQMGLAEAKNYVEAVAKGLDPKVAAAATPTNANAAGAGCLVTFLLIVIGAYFVFSGAIWERLIPPQGDASGVVQEAPASATPAIAITAADLVQAYKDNEVAADQRFKGKSLSVTGTIDTIGKDILDTPYITLSSGKEIDFRSVQAMFTRSAEGQLASLSKGDQVTIQGRCDGLFGNVLIKNALLR